MACLANWPARAGRAIFPLTALLLAGVALAQPRLAVVGAGDCNNSELLSDVRALTEALNEAHPGTALSESFVQQRLGAPSSSTPEELGRQLDAAQALFYDAANHKAERQALDALAEIERLPPGEQRWGLRVRAELFLAVLNKNLGRLDAYDEALRQVLKLAPSYQADPFYFAPGVRARIDKVRGQLKAVPKARLNVTSTPAGADVFLDGFRVGSTPYDGGHLPGSYVLELGHRGAFSLRHPLELRDDASVQVDVGFETALHPRRLSCVGDAGEESSLATGVKLGTMLETNEVVMLYLERPEAGGRGALKATLVNVKSGQKVRWGGISVLAPARPAEDIDQLAAFVVTGQKGPRVTVAAEAGAADAAGAKLRPAAASASAEPAAADQLSGEGPGFFERRTWKSKAAVGLGVAAVIGAGAGAIALSQANASWGEFNVYYAAGRLPTAAEVPAVKEIERRASGQQTSAFVCFGSAALVAGGAIALLVIDGPAPSSTQASVSPLPGGASLALRGRY